jgi:tetraacyldisaccharide 4'-kinase
MAINRWNSQIVILDDGFQYLRLARDVNIVTIDATRPFGFDHVLPRGYLREPLSALSHADLILLTRVDQCENLGAVRGRLIKVSPSTPIFESIYKPQSLYSLDTQQEMALDTIYSKNILAVCGVANPDSFVRTLQTLNPARIELLAFPDHHAYPTRSIEAINQRAAESDVDFIVTTEKDAQKLGAIEDQPILSLKVELKLVGTSADRFAQLIRELCDL